MFALLLAQNLGLCSDYTCLPEFGDFDLFWRLQISLNSQVFAPKITSHLGLLWEYVYGIDNPENLSQPTSPALGRALHER